jgi:hypothetical protein
LELDKRPLLTVYYGKSIEHGKAGITVLHTSHVAPSLLLATKDISATNWIFKGYEAGVPVFEFVHEGRDIHDYFNFESLINEDGDHEEGKLWATPVGSYVEQPFEERAYVTLYATQGGGTAIQDGHRYVFVDVPSWGQYRRGDDVPQEWGLQPCGTLRHLTEAEKDMAFTQGLYAGRDCEDDLPPFENHEADEQWRSGYRYGVKENRDQSAMIAYSD